MDEKKQGDNTGVDTNSTPDVAVPVVESVPVTETVPVVDAVVAESANVVDKVETAVASKSFNVKAYVGVVAVILVICAGLLFILEKEGRTSTGIFAGLTEGPAVATVDGVEISKADYDSSLSQLTNMTAEQGVDVTDAEVVAQLKTQALDTLVNAEVLRQAAVDAGITVTPEEVEARYAEIRDGIGGDEALMQRMAEFGVTEAGLRLDIENEFLIQGLFDTMVDIDSITVEDSEITDLYTQAGGVEAGLPPLEEVKEQIISQIKFDKEQELVSAYIEELRAGADVEIKI